MRKKYLLIVCVLFLLPAFVFGQSNYLVNLRGSANNKHCRLVFDARLPIHYRYSILSKPDRLVIEMDQIVLKHRIPSYFSKLVPLKSVKIAYHKQVLRWVLGLSYPVRVHAFQLNPTQHHPYYRLALDLLWGKQPIHQKVLHKETPVVKAVAISQSRQIHKPDLRPEERPKPKMASKSTLKHRRLIVIVIDPGHGGHDPGAIGVFHIKEKTVVLKISHFLQTVINQQPGFRAYLTRNADRYLSLRERLSVARRYKADLFVAIHADAFPNHHSSGASVFALSLKGATSEAARWLAQKENESELMGGVALSDKSQLLKSVLINLSQSATIRASLDIGRYMIQGLDDITALHYKRVEQAAFVVLKSPDIPSLLVETGFISNARGARKLINPTYQKRLARALMMGIRSYFQDNPPGGRK